MYDVFLSYANEDREWAEGLAYAVNQCGASCWWDRYLVGGQRFRDEIAFQIQYASAVIVLWSPHAVASPFVLDEADVAAAHSKLVSVRLSDFPIDSIPMGFRQYQAIQYGDEQGIVSALRGFGVNASMPPANHELVNLLRAIETGKVAQSEREYLIGQINEALLVDDDR